MSESISIEILHSRNGKTLATLNLSTESSIEDVKKEYQKKFPGKYSDRQAYKLDQKGKILKNSEKLSDIGLSNGGKLFFKDLGPQIGWTTVFLTEYAGPLIVYLIFYMRPDFIYGNSDKSKDLVVNVAMLCWVAHYAKRLLETIFVHRFSNNTMPILNIFKNSGYYWGFAAFVAYFVNHPLYTPPMFGKLQFFGGLLGFLFCELGNLSIHIALRNLRPAGSKVRKIPHPNFNPFTLLFNFVSCPNYTYEVGAWLSFSIMTQCLPAFLFTIAGFYQMAVWAYGKHRNYKQEFKNYPKGRRPIIPFI